MPEQDRRIDGTLGSANNPQFEVIGICHTCARRRGPWTCEAFPVTPGIPSVILTGKFLHVNPYKGDHGLQYVRKTGQVRPT